MHPTVMAALATERHAELLRTAERHRRTRLTRAPRPARRTLLGATAGLMLREGWQQLARLVPAERRGTLLRLTPTLRPTTPTDTDAHPGGTS